MTLTIATAKPSSRSRQGILDAEGRLTVTLPVAIDPKRSDQDYRIERG